MSLKQTTHYMVNNLLVKELLLGMPGLAIPPLYCLPGAVPTTPLIKISDKAPLISYLDKIQII